VIEPRGPMSIASYSRPSRSGSSDAPITPPKLPSSVIIRRVSWIDHLPEARPCNGLLMNSVSAVLLAWARK
jgi:hypothetical protein